MVVGVGGAQVGENKTFNLTSKTYSHAFVDIVSWKLSVGKAQAVESHLSHASVLGSHKPRCWCMIVACCSAT